MGNNEGLNFIISDYEQRFKPNLFKLRRLHMIISFLFFFKLNFKVNELFLLCFNNCITCHVDCSKENNRHPKQKDRHPKSTLQNNMDEFSFGLKALEDLHENLELELKQSKFVS